MKINKKILNEDTVSDLADKIGSEPDLTITPDATKGDIEEILDDALYSNLPNYGKLNIKACNNVLFIGESGTGKTGRITDWAKENGINLVTKVVSKLDAVDMGGSVAPSDPEKVTRKDGTVRNRRWSDRLSSREFDLLDEPYSVLFLDEFNTARPEVRTPLFKLVNEHVLDDPNEPDGLRHYPNLLFTVAAINPSESSNYDTYALSAAEEGRFNKHYIKGDKKLTLSYLLKHFDEIAEDQSQLIQQMGEPTTIPEKHRLEAAKRAINATEGRKALATALLSVPDSELHFDTSEEVEDAFSDPTNRKTYEPRDLTLALLDCNGTKDDFLKKFPYHCNKAKLPAVKRVLANYQDVEDKANDILKNHQTQSSVFKTKESKNKAFIKDLFDAS